MDQISIGSVVQVKSGGPSMTVESFARKVVGHGMDARNVEDKDRVNCQWFDKDGELKSGFFPVASLK
jgi:uncharacterized protein YodC (DUF2158 family)